VRIARQAICAGGNALPPPVEDYPRPQAVQRGVSKKKFGLHHHHKDGVTVSKEIELRDPTRTMGAQMVR